MLLPQLALVIGKRVVKLHDIPDRLGVELYLVPRHKNGVLSLLPATALSHSL